MEEKYGRAENLSCLILFDSVERVICNKGFCTKYLKRKHRKIFKYSFHKFSVQDHLHKRYCTFEKLVGETPIEIKSAVAKQTKKCAVLFLSNNLPATIFFYRKKDI